MRAHVLQNFDHSIDVLRKLFGREHHAIGFERTLLTAASAQPS